MNQFMFKTAKFRTIIITAMIFSYATALYAQVPAEEVTVVAPYQPSLSDVQKIMVNPELPETQIERPTYRFNISPSVYNTFFEPEKITPARLSGEPLNRLYQSYIRAGFGNYTTPFAELHYNNLYSRTANLGLYYKHHSSSGKIEGYAPANFSENVINIYGSRFLENHILRGDIKYNRHVVNYYGFNPDLFLIDDSLIKPLIYQRYATVEAEVNFSSNYTDKEKLHHAFGLRYYNFRDIIPIKENGLFFSSRLQKNVNFISALQGESIILDADIYYHHNTYAVSTQNASVYEVRPSYNFSSNQYALQLGVNASIESGDVALIHFFPIIEGNIVLAKDVFTIYGAIGGGIERNNLLSLYQENPFINTHLPLDFSITKISAKGGVKGNIASVFSFNLGASFAENHKMPFFINDTFNIMQNSFTVGYYDANVVNAFAGFTYKADDKLMFLLKGNFWYYDMITEAHPWHKPFYDASLSARYNLVDKIILDGEVYTQSKTYAKVFDAANMAESREVKAFTDLNLKLEYLYTKKLSAFISFNNLTAQRYYRWYNYPTQKFHFLAGATYAF